MTNGDRIRAMTDEEFAAYMVNDPTGVFCDDHTKCRGRYEAGKAIQEDICVKCALEWLRKPAEEVRGMARKSDKQPIRTCAECIHEHACKMWTNGREISADSASRCPNYETVRDSAAYLIGKMEKGESGPVMDAVEVVRCKDCEKIKDYGKPGNEWLICRYLNQYRFSDDFCSRGVRRCRDAAD